MEEAKKVYTESTPRLIELHKNYKGKKNGRSDESIWFDNCDSTEETGCFSSSTVPGEYYKEYCYTKLSEQEFIEFMKLEDTIVKRRESIDCTQELLDSINKQGLTSSTGPGKDLLLTCEKDNVNKPSHYTQGGIEPIDYILANDMNFLEGNVIKYVTRYKHKNGLEDLKKAEFYLKRLIEGLEELK